MATYQGWVSQPCSADTDWWPLSKTCLGIYLTLTKISERTVWSNMAKAEWHLALLLLPSLLAHLQNWNKCYLYTWVKHLRASEVRCCACGCVIRSIHTGESKMTTRKQFVTTPFSSVQPGKVIMQSCWRERKLPCSEQSLPEGGIFHTPGSGKPQLTHQLILAMHKFPFFHLAFKTLQLVHSWICEIKTSHCRMNLGSLNLPRQQWNG